MGTMVLGKVESGQLSKGQQLVLMPNKVHIAAGYAILYIYAACGQNAVILLCGLI